MRNFFDDILVFLGVFGARSVGQPSLAEIKLFIMDFLRPFCPWPFITLQMQDKGTVQVRFVHAALRARNIHDDAFKSRKQLLKTNLQGNRKLCRAKQRKEGRRNHATS